jgi:DNA mismatch repair protein MutS2
MVSEPVASAATAEALELPALLRLLAELAATDLGRRRALALAPYADPEALAGHRRRYEETARLFDGGRLVPGFEPPPGELLERLAGGPPAPGGADLVGLAALLRASREAAARIAAADPPCPELEKLASALPDLSALVREVGARLDRRGEVREDASPELSTLRRRIRGARDQIYRQLGGFVAAHRDDLGEETVPMRGGRLVVLLQAGARGRLSGLVHGRSGTGRSFYFEPLEVVEPNNQLQQAVEDEEAERLRILNELLAAAQAALPAIGLHAEFLAELDLHEAACRLAELAGARPPEPAPPGELRLVAARHPLLDPRLAELRRAALGQPGREGEVVPLDVAFSPEDRALVVTGPNAGGKTVALKTVGLLALAAQAGLPVPAAAGSALPFFRRVVATVGDEQDLMTDRSTFSGRLLRLDEAWRAAGPASLVLLDELGSGTDPEEGSALAVTLLEGLVGKGCLAVVTTHLAQVAAAALELPGAGCAAMEFDPETGRPSFRLVPGPPGGSEALALARRLGLAAEWLDRAEERLGSEHRDLRRLIAEVERVRGELAAERARAERAAAAAEELARSLQDERAELDEERRTLGRRLRAELEAFRRETLERLRGETERIRGQLEAGRRKGLAAEAVGRLFAAAPRPDSAAPAPAGPIALGGRVRHAALGWEGTLDKLDRGRAEVLVKGKRVRCGADELVGAGPAPGAAGAGGAGSAARGRAVPAAGGRRAVSADLATGEIPPLAAELNLIGRRVEPALDELDGYLDRALLDGREEVRIVHGHGSGRLRDAVREHLRRHPAVAAHRPGQRDEGGNGATVVTLRGD